MRTGPHRPSPFEEGGPPLRAGPALDVLHELFNTIEQLQKAI